MINIILTGLFSAEQQFPSRSPRPHRLGQKGNGDTGKDILNLIYYLTSQQSTFLDSLLIESCSSPSAGYTLNLLILAHICMQKESSFYQKLKIPWKPFVAWRKFVKYRYVSRQGVTLPHCGICWVRAIILVLGYRSLRQQPEPVL